MNSAVIVQDRCHTLLEMRSLGTVRKILICRQKGMLCFRIVMIAQQVIHIPIQLMTSLKFQLLRQGIQHIVPLRCRRYMNRLMLQRSIPLHSRLIILLVLMDLQRQHLQHIGQRLQAFHPVFTAFDLCQQGIRLLQLLRRQTEGIVVLLQGLHNLIFIIFSRHNLYLSFGLKILREYFKHRSFFFYTRILAQEKSQKRHSENKQIVVTILFCLF